MTDTCRFVAVATAAQLSLLLLLLCSAIGAAQALLDESYGVGECEGLRSTLPETVRAEVSFSSTSSSTLSSSASASGNGKNNVVRFVSALSGKDTPECLEGSGNTAKDSDSSSTPSTEKPPSSNSVPVVACASLQYALSSIATAPGPGNASNSSINLTQARLPLENLTVYVYPGTYRLVDAAAIEKSERVALIALVPGLDIDLEGDWPWNGEDNNTNEDSQQRRRGKRQAQDGSPTSTDDSNRVIFHCGTFPDEESCNYQNLQIERSNFVYVYGVTFRNCGPVTSNVYVAESQNVVFEDCHFEDNISPSVIVYQTSPIAFVGCSFVRNSPNDSSSNITNNVCYFAPETNLFFLDNRTTSGGISHYMEGKLQDFLIVNSLFFENTARPESSQRTVRSSRAFGHGGALNVRLLNSSMGRVCVDNTTFISNMAGSNGGAISLSVVSNSSENVIVFSNSTFKNNTCSLNHSTGGAVAIDLYGSTELNSIVFTDTNFSSNEADSGGALSLATTVSAEYNDRMSERMAFERCTFEGNQGFLDGTALSVFSLTHVDEIGLPVEMVDCNVTNNQATHGSIDTTAVTMYRVSLTFRGTNRIQNNRGGGLSMLSSRMDVKGRVEFEGNVAVFGGGVAMSGRSLILLFNGSYLLFKENMVSQLGAGLYVEYTSSSFLLAVLNKGCFIQYYTDDNDVPPHQWDSKIEFVNNTAGRAGGAMYASDLSRCKWLGNNWNSNYYIFQPPENYSSSPFIYSGNRISEPDEGTFTVNEELASDPSQIQAKIQYTATVNTSSDVSYGEMVYFELSSQDELSNFRPAVWSVKAPLVDEPLGAISTNRTIFTYEVPSFSKLNDAIQLDNMSANISVEFSLLGSEADSIRQDLFLHACHPGYTFDPERNLCQCSSNISQIIRCDSYGRYFYVREGYWVGVREDKSLYFATTIPGFLNCSRQGGLPGCLVKFDHLERQCVDGREGDLCGRCGEEGFGVTFDLRFCKPCKWYGIAVYVAICVITLLTSAVVLYVDIQFPNELKGVLFFAQVIGVIYRNTPYISGEDASSFQQFFDFILNMFGFSLPIPLCFTASLPSWGVALLGFVPPIIAVLTAVAYGFLARHVRWLSERRKYGFHGFYFLCLFAYKYLLDTIFIFISCQRLQDTYVFNYDGNVQCFGLPFVVFFLGGLAAFILLGLVLPGYVLYTVYQPQKSIQTFDVLTNGLKRRRRYLWYGVWDIWRRLPFVAASLMISFTTPSVILFTDCLLIVLCLVVVCVVKPYMKLHVNLLEATFILCLFGATLAILDQNDTYVSFGVGVFFICVPFVFGIIFICYRILQKIFIWLNGKYDLRSKWEERDPLRLQSTWCRAREAFLQWKTTSFVDEEEDEDEDIRFVAELINENATVLEEEEGEGEGEGEDARKNKRAAVRRRSSDLSKLNKGPSSGAGPAMGKKMKRKLMRESSADTACELREPLLEISPLGRIN